MNKKAEKQPLIDEILDFAKVMCVTGIIVILVYTFIGRQAWVSGESMEPTLLDKDFLILRSLLYTPEQGDIIACNSPGLGKVIVKRIAAVGGQTVTVDFEKGKVYVDGEEFLVDGIDNITLLREGRDITDLTVPEGKYFVLGDNRQNSNDSRSTEVGFVDREDILGKAVLRLFPFNRISTF